MQTEQELARHIESAEDLRSVVSTMKNLAAVQIRQYERAVEALEDYTGSIEYGLHVVLRDEPRIPPEHASRGERGSAAIVIGSDHGMVGDFNERIVDLAARSGGRRERRPVVAMGYRAAAVASDAGLHLAGTVDLPGSVEAITGAVGRILLRVGEWHGSGGIDTIDLFHNAPRGDQGYHPSRVRLYPLDPGRLDELRRREWPAARTLPWYRMDRQRLLSLLIGELLFVRVYRAIAESLMTENAGRLSAMQSAERNIEDRLADLRKRYNYQRQGAITAEMLDIAAGFEALQGDRS